MDHSWGALTCTGCATQPCIVRDGRVTNCVDRWINPFDFSSITQRSHGFPQSRLNKTCRVLGTGTEAKSQRERERKKKSNQVYTGSIERKSETASALGNPTFVCVGQYQRRGVSRENTNSPSFFYVRSIISTLPRRASLLDRTANYISLHSLYIYLASWTMFHEHVILCNLGHLVVCVFVFVECIIGGSRTRLYNPRVDDRCCCRIDK